MIVMEHLGGADFNAKHESDLVEMKLKRVIKNLHEASFVHGDVRANNICVVGNRVCLVDFDWSGRERVDHYPGFMNAGIAWAPGASDGLLLQAVHDTHMLEDLIK